VTDLSDPQPVGPPMADQLTGLFSAIAILAGLQHRATTGEGTQVEVSMLAACLAFQTLAVVEYCREGEVPEMTSRAQNSQSYAFVASDGLAMARHDVPAAPINRIDEALSHPQVEAIGIVERGDGVPPGLDGLVRSPISSGGAHPSSRLPPPLLGADSVSVLTGAGYTATEIEHVRSLEVLR
jgi:crotonobetainyl-CoA:carnitine CoA-transferase CaiB-like acyl-CoA transferase